MRQIVGEVQSGQYYNGLQSGRPHAQAGDEAARAQLRQLSFKLTGVGQATPWQDCRFISVEILVEDRSIDRRAATNPVVVFEVLSPEQRGRRQGDSAGSPPIGMWFLVGIRHPVKIS